MLTKVLYKSRTIINDKAYIIYKVVDNQLIIDIDFSLYKYDLFGKKFKINLSKEVKVKKNKPHNNTKLIYNNYFSINGHHKKIVIDLDDDYTYKGINIDINLNLLIKIDDAIFFDTKIRGRVENNIRHKKDKPKSSNLLMNPYDTYDFIKNFLSLNTYNYIIIIIVTLLGLLILGYNFYLLFMDLAFLTFFISILVLIKYFYFRFLKLNLKDYSTFGLSDYGFSKEINKVYDLSNCIKGVSNVDLKDVTIRVVAANKEVGQHVTGSGKSKSIKTFRKYVNGFVVYSETIPFIKKGEDISKYTKGNFSLKDIYKKLHPPHMLKSTHGVDIEWQIQFISKNYVDYIIKGPTNFIGDSKYFI